MPDSLETLASMPSSATRPLPAAEVRRQGDRRRRRHTAALVLGSAAVVAAVAVGGTWLASPDPDALPPTDPSPTVSEEPSPSESSTTEPPRTEETRIPAAFPLTDGWPELEQAGDWGVFGPGPDQRSMLFRELADPCPGVALPVAEVGDRTTARWSTPDAAKARELLTFPTAAAARAWWSEARAAWRSCTGTSREEWAQVMAFTPAHGQRAWEASDTLPYDNEPGAFHRVLQVTLLGHAVVVGLDEDSGADSPEAQSQTMISQSENLLREVCLQIAGACEPGSAEPQQPTSTLTAYPLSLDDAPASEQVGQGDVPDLAIDADLPDMTGDGGELFAPDADVLGVDRMLVCGQPILDQDATYTGRLATSSSGPEYFTYRQVVGFPDAAAAQAQMEHVRGLVAGCDPHATETRESEIQWTRVDADTGYDSFTAGYSYYAPGEDHIAFTGGEVLQLTRVGRAILVVGNNSEYGGAETIRSAAPDLTRLTRQLAPLLCPFTEAGC